MRRSQSLLHRVVHKREQFIASTRLREKLYPSPTATDRYDNSDRRQSVHRTTGARSRESDSLAKVTPTEEDCLIRTADPSASADASIAAASEANHTMVLRHGRCTFRLVLALLGRLPMRQNMKLPRQKSEFDFRYERPICEQETKATTSTLSRRDLDRRQPKSTTIAIG